MRAALKGPMTPRKAASLALFLFGAVVLAPLAFGGSVHGGLLFVPAAWLLAWALLRPPLFLALQQRCKWVVNLFKMGYILAAAIVAVILFFMIQTACAPTGESTTVIILGCQVTEEGPSLMLQRRMDAAIAYLESHPDAVAIATGAQGWNESMPESQAIFDYLVAKGIDPARIYIEGASRNTEQNLRFSAAIIREHGLDDNVVIASDGFHQFRAALFAQQHGLTSSPLSSRTPLGVALGYWLREILAVMRAVCLGY